MTITKRVKCQFFDDDEQRFIRISQRHATAKMVARKGSPWAADEHERFLSALEKHPSGPWKIIASYVGTRTTRQTMTHAQKYREKIARKKRAAEIDTTFQASRPQFSVTEAASATVSAATSTVDDAAMIRVTAVDAICTLSCSDIDGMFNSTLAHSTVATGTSSPSDLGALFEVPADLWWHVMDNDEWLHDMAFGSASNDSMLTGTASLTLATPETEDRFSDTPAAFADMSSSSQSAWV